MKPEEWCVGHPTASGCARTPHPSKDSEAPVEAGHSGVELLDPGQKSRVGTAWVRLVTQVDTVNTLLRTVNCYHDRV